MYRHQVNVYLRQLPVDENEIALEPAMRVLNLTPLRTVVKIGRASKSPSKGLQGAIDNAWFDSPVMSRNHAEIIYSPSEKKVQIRDVGSMHGTFVNGEKLGDDVKPLNPNDKIVFGIGVRRGMEMFPACHFDVAYDLIPWKKPNSYTVPDSSDEDEAYDYIKEGSSEKAFIKDDTSVELMEVRHSGPTAVSKSIDAIDLTLSDTPSPRLEPLEPFSIATTKIAKTKENEGQESAPKSPVLGHSPPIDVSMDRGSVMADGPLVISEPRTINEKNDRSSNLVDDWGSDDEDEDMASSPYDSDSAYLINPYDKCAGDSDASDPSDASERSEGSILAVKNRSKSTAISCSASSSAHVSFLSRPSPDPSVTVSRPPFENVDIPESHVRTKIDISVLGENDSGDEDEDDNASVGLSEAANQGLETLIEDGLLENKPANPLVSSCSPMNLDIWSNKATLSPKHESLAHHLTLTDLTSKSSWVSNREASPSAVAMVKAPQSSSMAEDSTDHFEPPWNSLWKRKLSVKELGDKTGKHAFFEAREDNKMQFQAHVDEDEGIQNDRRSESPKPSFSRPSRSINFAQPLNQFFQPIQPMKYRGNGFDHGFTTVASFHREAEINDQTTSSPPYCIGSAEERPSIHPYYFSSDASSRALDSPVLEKAPESPVLERHHARSGLRIDDIIDGTSTVKSSKRKADEISEDDNLRELFKSPTDDVRKNEVRNWASSVEKFDNSKTSPEAVSEVTHQLSTIEVPSMSANSNIETRPVKRLKMKKFAEAVGYFALGGAAVGAGLFSALVATAPDFL